MKLGTRTRKEKGKEAKKKKPNELHGKRDWHEIQEPYGFQFLVTLDTDN